MRLSVVIPTYNPDAGRLARTIEALHEQTLSIDAWEIMLVDNASSPPVSLASFPSSAVSTRLVREPIPGLTAARRRGISESCGELIVFVDDDNLLAPHYLAHVLAHFEAHPQLGALGGKSIPEFEQPPPSWWESEFTGLLACRDLGNVPQLASDRRDPKNGQRLYPHCAPVGAGMALRRGAVKIWLDEADSTLSDRRGNELTSGGDNDICLTLLLEGWQVGYFPDLVLTHLIPATRLQRDYLGRLNRSIAKSWIHVLQKHHANPWPAISPRTVRLRQLKAWFTYRAWSGPAQFVRWQGACGHFEGRASNPVVS